MKSIFNFLILAATNIILTHSIAQAHGEDKPGPHGGVVQMPGPFHTEVVVKNGEYQVYLLDINFKNPTVTNSQVDASIKDGEKLIKLNCQAKADYFSCDASKIGKKGELVISSTRENKKGKAAIYSLPLNEGHH